MSSTHGPAWQATLVLLLHLLGAATPTVVRGTREAQWGPADANAQIGPGGKQGLSQEVLPRLKKALDGLPTHCPEPAGGGLPGLEWETQVGAGQLVQDPSSCGPLPRA